jgi:hypothetical protein
MTTRNLSNAYCFIRPVQVSNLYRVANRNNWIVEIKNKSPYQNNLRLMLVLSCRARFPYVADLVKARYESFGY